MKEGLEGDVNSNHSSEQFEMPLGNVHDVD